MPDTIDLFNYFGGEMKFIQRILALAILIMSFAMQDSMAQQVMVEYPLQNAVNITQNPTIKLKALYPFKFKAVYLDSLRRGMSSVIYKTKQHDSLFVVNGSFSLYNHDTSRTEYVMPNAIGIANIFNDTVLLLNISSTLKYSTAYDIVIKNLELYNTTTQELSQHNLILESRFTTVEPPIKLLTTNISSGLIKCNDTIYFKFNRDISGVDVNKLIGINSVLWDQHGRTLKTINYSYNLSPDKKTLYLKQFNVEENLIYEVSYNGSVISGNSNDDLVIRLRRENIATIIAKSKVFVPDSLNYYNIANESLVPNKIDGIGVVERNTTTISVDRNIVLNRTQELEFVRWDAPTLPQYHNITNNVINVSADCQNVGVHNLTPIYRTIPVDTVYIPHDTTICKVQVKGYRDSLSYDTYLVNRNDKFTLNIMANSNLTNSAKYKFTGWKTNLNPTDYDNGTGIPQGSPTITYCMKRATSLAMDLYELDWRRKLRFDPQFDPHWHEVPVSCKDAFIKFDIVGENYIDNTFLANPQNLQIFVDNQLVPYTVNGLIYATGNSRSYPIGTLVPVKIVINNEHHYISHLKYLPNSIDADMEEVNYYHGQILVTSTFYECYNVFTIRLDRRVHEVEYSWLAKDDVDEITGFNIDDLSLNPVVSNQNTYSFSPGTSRKIEYLVANSKLVQKITCYTALLGGSNLTLTPYRKNIDIDFLKSWVCAQPFDCFTIDPTTHIHNATNINRDWKFQYEFRSPNFKILDMAIEDVKSSHEAATGYKSIELTTAGMNGNSSDAFAAMHTPSRQDYLNLSPSVQQSIGRDNLTCKTMYTTTVRLTFNKRVDLNSLPSGLILYDVSRNDNPKMGYWGQYAFDVAKNVSDVSSDGRTIIVQIIDANNGLEVSHMGQFKVDVTSGIKDMRNAPLCNPCKRTIETEGPGWNITLTKVHCKVTEDDCGADEQVIDIAVIYKTFDDMKQVSQDTCGYKRYPGSGELDLNNGEDFIVPYDPLAYVKLYRKAVLSLGIVATDGDSGDVISSILDISCDILDVLNKNIKNTYLSVGTELVKIVRKYAKNWYDDDDALGDINTSFDLNNHWGTNRIYYRAIDKSVEIGKYLTIHYQIYTFPDQSIK